MKGEMQMKPKYFMIDVEANGVFPDINDGKMTEFGCVVVSNPIIHGFWGRPFPKSIPIEASIEIVESGNIGYSPTGNLWDIMFDFESWILNHSKDCRPVFVSDNNGFDWKWIDHAFISTIGYNPFGHSSQNMGSLYKGMVGTMRKNFKHLRVTKHTHNPVMDCIGNVEALIVMSKEIDGIF